jgi:hypothetical protein
MHYYSLLYYIARKKTCSVTVKTHDSHLESNPKPMDLQKLRPTKSQWRAPLDTPAERRVATLQKPQPQTAAKRLIEPPKGKGGPLWQKFYADAVARKHPLPEKLADTLLRSRERALELEAARHKTQVTMETPKPSEAAVVNNGTKKVKAALHDALRCKALTLEGRRCGFKATCGDFCKKHSVEKM